MRIVLILLMCVSFAYGQNDTTKYFVSKDYGWSWQRGKFKMLVLPTDTVNNKLGVAQLSNGLYYGNGTYWQSVGGGSPTLQQVLTAGNISTLDATVSSITAKYPQFIRGYIKLNAINGSTDIPGYLEFYKGDNTKVASIGGNDGSNNIDINSGSGWNFNFTQAVPKAMGNYLVTSVNGILADVNGNITDTSYKSYADSSIAASTPIVTLQDVTDNGNTTTQDIISTGGSIKGLSLVGRYDGGGGGILALYNSLGTSTAFLKSNNLTSNKTIELPNSSSTLSTSVNGNFADANGNITISTGGSGTVTSVATGLGLSGGTITTSGTVELDTANSNVISRQRAAATYQATLSGTGAVYSTAGVISYKKDIDSTERTYTDSIIYTGGTRPSGTNNHTYEWSQKGRLVTFRINILFGTPGSGNTVASLPFPSVMPTPTIPSGFTVSNSSRMYILDCNGGNNTTIVNPLSAAIVYNAATPVIHINAAAQNLAVLQITGTYFTNN